MSKVKRVRQIHQKIFFMYHSFRQKKEGILRRWAGGHTSRTGGGSGTHGGFGLARARSGNRHGTRR